MGTAPVPPNRGDPEPDAGRTLRQYAAAIWLRRGWIALLAVLGAAGGWLQGRRQPDVFAVRTEIDITKQRPTGASPGSFGEGYYESQIYYPTRYKLLASGRTIASLFDERRTTDGTSSYPMWDWLTWPAWHERAPWEGDAARVAALESAYGPPVESALAFEQLTGLPVDVFRTRFAFRAYGPATRRSATSPFASPADLRDRLEGRIDVEPVKGTALVDIELSGERREILAPLLNLLIETFSREERTNGQRRLALERRAGQTQREVLVGVPGAGGDAGAGALRRAEEALKRWGDEHGRTANELELRRTVLSTQIQEAETELRTLSGRLETQRGELEALLGRSVPETTGIAWDREAAAALRAKIDEISRIETKTPDGPFHRLPFVVADRDVAEQRAKVEVLAAQRASVESARSLLNIAVTQAALRVAQPLARDLEVRASRRARYEQDLEELATSWRLANDLGRLQTEFDRRTKDLAAIDDRLEKVRTQELVESGLQPLRVVEPATDPSRPVRPNRLLLVLAGLGAGLLLGFAVALLLEWLDDTVGDAEDVARHLHAPVLGTIVALGAHDEGAAVVDRIATKAPRSPVAEAFRAVRTSVEFLGAEEEGPRVILVSSCSPREGKTTVASNLAAVLAQDGKRTLLVDADMRRPRVHAVFGVEHATGLSNVIAGRLRLEEAVVGTDQENLWVLPAGATPPNPAELLGRKAAVALFERLGREFDRVVVDTPPIGVVTDAAVLGRLATQILLVVAAGRTKKRAAEHGEALLRTAGASPAGVVLNLVRRGSRSLYGGYYGKDAAAYYGAPPDATA